MERKGDWIQTFSGGQAWPLDPRHDEVRIEDIAHHLSNLCRFTGACLVFYSVAEHSVHVASVVASVTTNRMTVLQALLHDAAEAYCNDIARPVKLNIDGYATVERANEYAIFDRFVLPFINELPRTRDLIKHADNAMLMAEQAAIMAPCEHRWKPQNPPRDMVDAANERGPFGLSPPAAELAFLRMYRELTA
jgi:hypothetical protein